MKLMQIVTRLDQNFIGSRSWICRRGHARLARHFRIESQIPWFPVIHIRTRFVPDDPGIAPNSTGEFLVETRTEHGPLAAIGMAQYSDAIRVHVWNFRQDGMAICRDIPKKGKWLAPRT